LSDSPAPALASPPCTIVTGNSFVFAPYPVTAFSAVNALGTTTRGVVDALSASRSGLGRCSLELTFETVAGEVPEAPPPLPPHLAAFDSRTARLAVAALDEVRPPLAKAIARHGAGRVGLVIGTTTAGLARTEEAYQALQRTGRLPADYDFHRQHSFGGLLEAVRRVAGTEGPALVVSTACSASAKALAGARRMIAAGVADAVLVGGVDGLCLTTLYGFHSLEILSPTACRPFSSERNGITIGEGAAYLLLERSGEARAHLLGVGESSDAYHMAAPHPEGAGALGAMREALANGGVAPAEVDHINAHSPGTKLNDLSEGRALSTLFGDGGVPVCSTKGYTGHLLGAAGATEAVFSIVALEQGWIPRSLGADPADVTLGLDIVTARRGRTCRRVLSNSFAFGGNNVSLLFGSAA
jgi:3-oxoacyl-[acyl-carrier-protein] synthase-1